MGIPQLYLILWEHQKILDFASNEFCGVKSNLHFSGIRFR